MRRWNVGYLIGSLAKAAIDRRLAAPLVRLRLAPASLSLHENAGRRPAPCTATTTIATTRKPARAFEQALAAADAVLFVTPEYKRSIPGALKNAIDWRSRPWAQNSFARKRAALIGASPGKNGTAVGQQHLRSILGFCNAPQMNAVEAYLQSAVTGQDTEDLLRHDLAQLHDLIVRLGRALPKDA